MTLQRICRVTLWLGAASLLAYVLAFLALQDIYHAEDDLTLEWRIVRLSMLIIGVFHGFALAAAWKGRAGSGPGS
jgi:O-antigen/teichoic acid export membrane protein